MSTAISIFMGLVIGTISILIYEYRHRSPYAKLQSELHFWVYNEIINNYSLIDQPNEMSDELHDYVYRDRQAIKKEHQRYARQNSCQNFNVSGVKQPQKYHQTNKFQKAPTIRPRVRSNI